MMRPSATILFVDDEEAPHQLFNLVFSNTNFKLLNAYNGMEAIKIVEKYKNQISLIITDYLLPDMNGNELYNSLKTQNIFPKISVVFQTGLNEKDIIIQDQRDIDILVKPYSASQLTTMVKKHIPNVKLSKSQRRVYYTHFEN